MGDRAKAILGFGLAAGVLVLLADVAPKFAVGTAVILGLGIALSRSQEITNILDTWTAAVGKSGVGSSSK